MPRLHSFWVFGNALIYQNRLSNSNEGRDETALRDCFVRSNTDILSGKKWVNQNYPQQFRKAYVPWDRIKRWRNTTPKRIRILACPDKKQSCFCIWVWLAMNSGYILRILMASYLAIASYHYLCAFYEIQHVRFCTKIFVLWPAE